MERLSSINPDRIKWCCDDRGLAPEDLATELGFSPSRFEKVLTGQEGLTFNQLRKLAAYFNRGVLFFLEKDPVNASRVYSPQFRTIANQKPELSPKVKSLIQRVEKQRDLYLGLREDLDEDEQIRFSPPALKLGKVEQSAAVVRKWLGLSGDNDFASYRAAIEAKGVLVFRSNGYSGPWQIPGRCR